jgi:acyl-CoA dehydrogenase
MIALTDEQLEIQRLCREFASREIRPVSLAVDAADGEVPWEVWRKAAGIGLTSFMLPAEYGGGGMTDCLTGCLVQEELSHGCSGIGNLITSGGFFAEPVLALGSAEQKKRWITPLAGEDPPLTALAITEPASGSDAASIRTRARRVDGGYMLSGQKAWISNGGVSRFYVVFATVSPGSGHRGITAFVVEDGDAGLTCGPLIRKMGQRAIPNTELFLDDVFVPDDRRLGE